MPGEIEDRPRRDLASAWLACLLLIVSAVLVLSLAKYQALLDETRAACDNVAAQLDLSSWVPLCRRVGSDTRP